MLSISGSKALHEGPFMKKRQKIRRTIIFGSSIQKASGAAAQCD
jgi:hypothetical protein